MSRSLTLAVVLASLAFPALAQTKLTGEDWKITMLEGEPAPEKAELTINFGPEQRVSGHSGCNRFMGGYTQDGLSLEFTQMASTMMACPPEQMELERKVGDLLARTKQFTVTKDGELELWSLEGPLLRAAR